MKKILILIFFSVSLFIISGCGKEQILNEYISNELEPNFDKRIQNLNTLNQDIYLKNMNLFLQKKEGKKEILENLNLYKKEVKSIQKNLLQDAIQVKKNKDISNEDKIKISNLYINYANFLNKNISTIKETENKIKKNKIISNSTYLINNKRLSKAGLIANSELINYLEDIKYREITSTNSSDTSKNEGHSMHHH